jgi:quinol monooxygenase YgiN
MVRLSVSLGAASGRSAQALLEGLRYLMPGTQLEPGCQECSLWAEANSTVHYVETWATEVDMQRRVRSPRFTSLLAVIESGQEPRKVQFDFVTTTRGIDYVAEIRNDATSQGARSRE